MVSYAPFMTSTATCHDSGLAAPDDAPCARTIERRRRHIELAMKVIEAAAARGDVRALRFLEQHEALWPQRVRPETLRAAPYRVAMRRSWHSTPSRTPKPDLRPAGTAVCRTEAASATGTSGKVGMAAHDSAWLQDLRYRRMVCHHAPVLPAGFASLASGQKLTAAVNARDGPRQPGAP